MGFVEQFQGFNARKQEPKALKNEEGFIRNEVMREVEQKYSTEREEMEKQERQKRYAIQVHEKMVIRDQETLAKYILLLEDKIRKRMIEKKSLLMDVYHLRGESDKMRFTAEEMKGKSEIGASLTRSHLQNGEGSDLVLPDGTRARVDEEESDISKEEEEYVGTGTVAAAANGLASSRGQIQENATKEMASASMLNQ